VEVLMLETTKKNVSASINPSEKYHILLVGGFNPSKKYRSVGMIIPNIWKNKKCAKPPIS
jgi:hypothetical protein